QFWWYLGHLLWRYPHVVSSYLSVCAQAEHFLEYRQMVRAQIETQLAAVLAQEGALPVPVTAPSLSP
ncbi:MAG: DUF4070 domain-containing protein, partial [Gloeomargarita sp. DG02_4_bins_56]